ncbi:MAG TPA: SDR family NAD(P)-dependent oxidoreductase [Streptosporangiaceae bacterium]|nr:SDR family NAD(P)-dependent oxidoreductase [Streptosporangiaceae bacterium]
MITARPGQLDGRTVLVTGGNRGIGLGLACGVAAAGATVVIWGRDESASAAAVRRLREYGGTVEALPCELSDESSVIEAFGATVAVTGRVDAVFANAGIASAAAPFHEQTDDEWRRVWQVNLGGVVFTLRAAIRHMLERGEGGSLVGVGSMAARVGMRNFSPYSTSKAAVVALMQTLAVEYARRGIRANAVLPGWVETSQTADASPRLREWVTRRTPIARFGTPDDFAGAAVFLADPTQAFHTGDTLLLDGGYLKI